jgi:hypothetical protein
MDAKYLKVAALPQKLSKSRCGERRSHGYYEIKEILDGEACSGAPLAAIGRAFSWTERTDPISGNKSGFEFCSELVI